MLTITDHSKIRNNYSKLRAFIRRLIGYPIICNANKANEKDYNKRALLVYLVKPFQLKDDDPRFLNHQNLMQCRQIASVLGEFGFIVDVADVKDENYKISRYYDLIVSHKINLKSNESNFKKKTIKIYLSTGLNHVVHNRKILKRYKRLLQRRKCNLKIRQIHQEDMPYVYSADAIVGFGNDFTMNTWKETFKKTIYSFNNYGFKTTKTLLDSKEFLTARKNFLFFASGTQICKGLDLLLEIFPRHPNLNLYICSNFENEKDFCKCYHYELYETANIHPIGRIRVNSNKFYDLIQKCAYVILPSCSDASTGSVVQCMYAGLIPVVTKEVGIDTDGFGVTLAKDNIEDIEKTIIYLTALPEQWHRKHSVRTREIAEKKFSEDAFMNRWREIMEIIKQRN